MSTPPLPRESDRSKYPGMRPREGQVFRLWLQQHEAEYDSFTYNVRVGPGRPLQGDYDDATKRNALLASQRRIDAIGWLAGVATLIEVKDFAIEIAIGQLLEYARLWQTQFPAEQNPRLLIVCSNHAPGFLERAAAAGVQVHVLLPH
jgi:hypothetical protein